MTQFIASSIPTAAHVVEILAVKVVALSLAVSLTEARWRELVPLVGVIYAVLLPVALWLAAP